MFGFKKKQQPVVELIAPVEGQVIPLAEVPDPVFSAGVMGYGYAVRPTAFTVCAPLSGDIIMMFPTAHAFAIRSDEGAEVLIHIGVDTVTLKGEGFRALCGKGDRVSAGQPVVECDPAIAEDERVKALDTIVVVTNGAQFTPSDLNTSGTNPVMTLTAGA